MDNIKIDTYRGFDILFDKENDRFFIECDGSSWNEKKTYSACKKWVDDYIKDNHVFKPFMVQKLGSTFDTPQRLKIVGIRKDERFLYETANGKSQISEYDEKNYFLVKEENEKTLATIAVLSSEIDAIENKIKEHRKSLVLVSLKDIKSQYIQPK